MSAVTLATLFYVALLLCGLGIVAYLVLMTRLISNLRDSHHDVYVQLGEPSLFMNNNIANGMRLVSFIVRGRFLSLQDGRLITLGRACRVLMIVVTVAFVFCWIVLAHFWQDVR